MFQNRPVARMGVALLMLAAIASPIVAVASPAQAEMLIAQAKAGKKKRIAVLDFDGGSIGANPYVSGYAGIGAAKGVGDLVINKLVDSGTYRVIERGKIDQLLKEQDLGGSGRVDASTAAQIGKLLGVEAVLIGSITQFNVDSKSSGFSLGGLFGTSSVKNIATVQITARLVDTETGEIVATAKGQGSADEKSAATSVLGIGGGSSTVNPDTLLTKAATDAVDQMVGTIVSAESKLSGYIGDSGAAEAKIADITGGSITLNKGTAAGFSKGMMVSVERVTKQVKDPETGRVIRTVSTSVGTIELTEVSKDYAVGRIVSGSGFREGDTVKSMAK